LSTRTARSSRCCSNRVLQGHQALLKNFDRQASPQGFRVRVDRTARTFSAGVR
jgi:hypothetical protein